MGEVILSGTGAACVEAQAEVPVISLEPLGPEKTPEWDRLTAPFNSRELFHRSIWLRFLQATQGATPLLCTIRAGDAPIGYFSGGIVRKGPFKILGSPLKGWGTNFMGPIANHLDQEAFLRALDELARRERLSIVELEGRALSEQSMARAGYEATLGKTFLVKLLPETPDGAWNNLESTCRNRVRKAIKSGLFAEDCDDPEVVDEFYGFYSNLMAHKRLPMPYGVERARQLFRHLKTEGLLFAVRVKNKQGEVLAAGLYPHDDRCMYFWGGASSLTQREVCPNEFLHWSAMSFAIQRGVQLYDTCGPGQFKKKFGGELVILRRWHKCFSRSAKAARRMYQAFFEYRNAISRKLKHSPDD